MSTPLHHGLEATPGQESECNLAQHQKKKLLAVVSPAKETPEGLIFMYRILKIKRRKERKAETLIPGSKAWPFPDVNVQERKQGEETGLCRSRCPWCFRGDRSRRLPPPCLVPADGKAAPFWLPGHSGWIQDHPYEQSQGIKNLMGTQLS